MTGTLTGVNAYFSGEIEASDISSSGTMSSNSLNVNTNLSSFNVDVYNEVRTNSLIAANITINEDLHILGNLTVDGDTTLTKLVADEIILNGNELSSYSAGDAIRFRYVSPSNQGINVLYNTNHIGIDTDNRLYLKKATKATLGAVALDDDSIKMGSNDRIYVDFSILYRMIPDAPVNPYIFSLLDMTDTNTTLPKEAGSLILNLNSTKNGLDYEFESTIISGGDWLTKVSDIISGEQKSAFDYALNDTPYERSGSIKIVQSDSLKELIIYVTQEGTPIILDPEYEFEYLPSGVFNGTVEVDANDIYVTFDFISKKDNQNIDYTVIKSGDSWVTVDYESSSIGSYKSSRYTFDANTTYVDRVATLRFRQNDSDSEIVIAFKQKGKPSESIIKFDDISQVVIDSDPNSQFIRSITSTYNGEWKDFSVTSPSNITAEVVPAQSGTSRNYTFSITTGNTSNLDIPGIIQLTQN
jgi:hypothetical protein